MAWPKRLLAFGFCLSALTLPACKSGKRHDLAKGPDVFPPPTKGADEARTAQSPYLPATLTPAAGGGEEQAAPAKRVQIRQQYNPPPPIAPPSIMPEGPPRPAEPQSPLDEFPILKALYHFLKDRPQEALQVLNRYDPKDQELLLRLLPPLAQVDRGGLLTQQMSKDEKQALVEIVRRLASDLQASAPLLLDKLVFCQEIKGYGMYQCRPTNQFRPGDRVMLYAELQNLIDRRDKDGYVARLSTVLEIRNAELKVVRSLQFAPAASRSASLRTDHFTRILFTLPADLPPGYYTLRVRIIDDDSNREADKSLTLQVTSLTAEP